ncbi:hypothetical protein [Aquamicrobium zhengzhouense]|uniref:Uncharacterized protein n=1 Tax=Aquamicrobium zhengzhouense TaxID=2781738 RepID=A0ABS0S9X9_9HYPH|nr:hypothetical protein [Aquamicrobium zhengzhouense]MBI1620067.1 hypothetical protein [Aquamicrobium zhengzhouense]
MSNNEIPPRPSVDQMADSALLRAGLRDRRIPDLKEAPRHLLDTGIEYHETIQVSPGVRAWTIFAALAGAIGLFLWVML